MMIKHSNSVVLLGILSFGVSACGQNPNVNSHYFAPIAQNGTAVNAPAPAPSQAQAQPSVPVLDTSGKSVIPKQDDTPPPLPSQLTGLSGDPLPNLPPATLPIVVLAPQNPDPGSNGQDGKPGQNGQNGKDGQNGKGGCGVRAFTLQFPARPFTDAEKILYAKNLPYRSTTGYPAAEHLNHHIPTIQLGEMTGMNDGIPFVANSQIEMAVDVALPVADSVVQIQDLTMRMYVSKLSQEKYIDTEMLCFIDEKLCSGEVFQASNWQKNINPSFFANGKPANENFVRAYTERAVGSVPVYRNVKTTEGTIKRELVKRDPVYASGISLPISDIVEGSGVTATQLLYGQAGTKIASDSSSGLYERTLHIVVADDTYVREDAEVVVTLTADTCKMPNIELKAK